MNDTPLFEPRYVPLPDGLTISDNRDHAPRCQLCEQKVLLRRESLTTRVVKALREIVRVNVQEKRPATMKDIAAFAKTLPVSDTEKRNTQNTYTMLRYWEFIESVTTPIQGKGGKIKEVSGWKVTQHALDFLSGKILVPDMLWVFNGEPRENPNHEKTFVAVHQVREPKLNDRATVAAEADRLETDVV